MYYGRAKYQANLTIRLIHALDEVSDNCLSGGL